MATPTQKSWEELKRIVRYIRSTQTARQLLTIKSTVMKPEWLEVYCDANWASGANSQGGKSTSCGFMSVGGFPLVFFSRTQSVISLSSCEAELFALTAALQEARGVHTLLGELGLVLRTRAHTDSSAAIGAASRRGLGSKLRHVSLRELWVQAEVQSRRVCVNKVLGTMNPADLGTKHLGAAQIQSCCQMVGLSFDPDQSNKLGFEKTLGLIELGGTT